MNGDTGEGGEETITPETRTIASDVSVMAIALVGVALVLVAWAWKAFEPRFAPLPSRQKSVVINVVAVISALLVVPQIGSTAVGIFWPDLAPAGAHVAATLMIVAFFFYFLVHGAFWVARFLTERKKTWERIKITEETSNLVLYALAIALLVLSIFTSTFAMYATIQIALDINIGLFPQLNFNFARFLLIDGVLFFMVGLFTLGFAFAYKKTEQWKPRQKP